MPRPLPSVTILSKPDCLLCDIAKGRVANVARQFGITPEVVDIISDAQLYEKYSDRIPVVLVDGEEAFAFRVSEKGLARIIRRGHVRRRLSDLWRRW